MTGTSGQKNSDPSNSTANFTVVLFDSDMDDQQLLNMINQNSKLVIITFDYESHQYLSKNNIPHSISDIYLQDVDISTIQEMSYYFSYWFKENKISDFLEYEGINLGQLYQVEFHYHLIPFIKRFVEFKNIIKEYKNAEFFASDTLFDIVKSFTSNVSKYQNNVKSTKFLYDSVKIPFNLGNRNIDLKISREHYLKLKGYVEIFVHQFLLKANHSSGKSVLLVEFDPIKYKKLVESRSKKNLNFVFFNRRRPAVWNLKSFKIIKKSKSYVITQSEINNELCKKIDENRSIMETRLESLIEESFFHSFFSIFEYSFWQPLKPIFLSLATKRIREAIYEIELAKTVFNKFTFSAVLVWSEIGFNEQIIIRLAQKMKIPVILIQHGLYYDTQKAFDFNKLVGIFPFDSDKFIVWGKTMENYAIECDIPEKKILTFGSPSLDGYFEQKTFSNASEDYVLLATSSPTGTFVSNLTVKTREQYEESIKTICRVVKKMNKKLIVKLHPFSEELDISNIIKEIDPSTLILKTANFESLVKSCQVFVTIDISTTILEAQIFQKPVISLAVKDYGFDQPTVLLSNSCISTNINDFEKVLAMVLKDPAYRKNLIDNGTNFLNNYILNQGKASEKIFEFLENM